MHSLKSKRTLLHVYMKIERGPCKTTILRFEARCPSHQTPLPLSCLCRAPSNAMQNMIMASVRGTLMGKLGVLGAQQALGRPASKEVSPNSKEEAAAG